MSDELIEIEDVILTALVRLPYKTIAFRALQAHLDRDYGIPTTSDQLVKSLNSLLSDKLIYMSRSRYGLNCQALSTRPTYARYASEHAA